MGYGIEGWIVINVKFWWGTRGWHRRLSDYWLGRRTMMVMMMIASQTRAIGNWTGLLRMLLLLLLLLLLLWWLWWLWLRW